MTGRWTAFGNLWRTLKFRVVLVAVLSALGAGAASTFYVTSQTQTETIRQIMRQQSDEVELVAGVLGSKIEQTQRVLRLLAYSIPPDLLESPERMQAFVDEKPAGAQFFDTLQIAGLDGVLRTNALYGKPLRLGDVSPAQRDLIERTLQSRQAIISEPMAGLKDEPPAVVFTMPLVSAEGRMFGVVAGGLKLQGQGLLPSSMDIAGSFGSTLVVYDRDGIVLFHPDPAQMLRHVSNLPGLGDLHREWIEAGGNIIAEGTTRIVGGQIASMAGMPLPQWMVARVTPSSVALAPMEAVQYRAWRVTAAVMGLCAVLAALLIWWMTYPITLLRNRAARGAGDGIAPGQGWPRADGEIGELAAALRDAAVERALQQQAQQVMVRQLQGIMTHAPVGIFIARHGRFELVGRQADTMLGYASGALLGLGIERIFGSEDAFAETQRQVSSALAQHGYFDTDVLLQRKDGTQFWAHVVGRSLNPGGDDRNHIWIFEDVTLAREMQQELSWSATHDALTHLANRREFEARFGRALLARRGSATPLALMFIDLDYFKAINDSAGHAAGDEVLVHIARLLEAQVRQSDTVGRLGGDEFAVLLPGCTIERAAAIAEKIRAAVVDWQPQFAGCVHALGTSIGVVSIDDNFADIAAALHAADTACYQAKREGRNRVVVHARAKA